MGNCPGADSEDCLASAHLEVMFSSTLNLSDVGKSGEQVSQSNPVISLCISWGRTFPFEEVHSRYRISGYCIGVALFYCLSDERALQIVDRIQRGEVQPDIAVVAELVSRQSMGAGAELLNLAWTVLIISWLIGIADSYRVGRLQGRADVGSG